jgi:hypothetical protein
MTLLSVPDCPGLSQGKLCDRAYPSTIINEIQPGKIGTEWDPYSFRAAEPLYWTIRWSK